MLIKRAEFITSLASLRDFPGRGLPEVALAGRSNVGKSSLVNCIAGRNKLARTSGEPGKTRLINIYSLNDALVLADLPGYGFASVARAEKAKWAEMIEGYLTGSEHLRLALQLVDIRHAPTADDIDMLNYLRHFGRDYLVVATKCDKLSRAQRARAVSDICRALGVQPWQVLPFSAVTREGRDALLEKLAAVAAPKED